MGMNISTTIDRPAQTGLSSLCVFCGSKEGNDPAYKKSAEMLGRALAKAKIKLVYGGAGIGIMGAIANATLTAGGQVTGVVPSFLTEMEPQLDDVTDLIKTDTMHERKMIMYDLSDAFAVFPGGIGTLDETMEVLTWRYLQVHAKPIILVNIDGYWDPFITLMDHVVERGFASQETRDQLHVVDCFEQVIPEARSAVQKLSQN